MTRTTEPPEREITPPNLHPPKKPTGKIVGYRLHIARLGSFHGGETLTIEQLEKAGIGENEIKFYLAKGGFSEVREHEDEEPHKRARGGKRGGDDDDQAEREL